MQQVDDPPYLSVGTEVSAKYKGAFCEAKVRKVVRNIKCKIAYKQGLGSGTVSDDQIKGDLLRVGATVEVKHPDRREFVEATITKIQDCSQYTVVFDDGDITTLRRSALCLKSGRHFNESETLDQLPLTHPEHFGNPVIGGRRGRRSRHMHDDSSDDDDEPDTTKQRIIEKEEHIGKVVCVENTEAKKKTSKENWFPALVVAPTAQDTVRIRVKEEYLVRSFKDGRYYTVPKKEAMEFTREKATKQDSDAVQAALEYLDNDSLPPHWDRDSLFSTGNCSSDFDNEYDSDSSDDEPREEKDHFVAQLYKYMDDRGTPLNKGPSIVNRDVDLYRLFRAVRKLGGYNRVTSQSQWKQIATRLGYTPTTTSIQNLVKQAYKKFLLPFEEFDRKLGCTMVAHPRANRIKGRSLVRANSVASPKPEHTTKEGKMSSASIAADESENTSESSSDATKSKRKMSTGSSSKVRALVERFEEKSKEDSGRESGGRKEDEVKEIKETREVAKKSNKDTSNKEIKPPNRGEKNVEKDLDNLPLSRTNKNIHKDVENVAQASGSQLSGLMKKEKPTRRSQQQLQQQQEKQEKHQQQQQQDKQPDKQQQQHPQQHPQPDPERKGKKRKEMEQNTIEKLDKEKIVDPNDFPIEVGDKLKVYYHEQKVTYEAKVIEISIQQGNPHYLVHYTGWNTRYDEWVPKERIAENLTNNKTNKRAKTGPKLDLKLEKQIEQRSGGSSSGSTSKPSIKRIRGSSRGDSQPPRSTTPSSVASNSSRTKSPATPAQRRTTRGQPASIRRTSNNTDISSVQTDTDSDSDEPVKKAVTRKMLMQRSVLQPTISSPNIGKKSSNSNGSSEEESLAATSSKGRNYDLNQIRSELKGFKELKSPSPDADTENSMSEKKFSFPSSASNADSADYASQDATKNTTSDSKTSSETSSESDSFGDDDSQFSDKTTTLENISAKLHEKFQAGKLDTDVFKKSPTIPATTTTTPGPVISQQSPIAPPPPPPPSSSSSSDELVQKMATLKPSGIEKIIKNSLEGKPKALPEKMSMKTLCERSPLKIEREKEKRKEESKLAAETAAALAKIQSTLKATVKIETVDIKPFATMEATTGIGNIGTTASITTIAATSTITSSTSSSSSSNIIKPSFISSLKPVIIDKMTTPTTITTTILPSSSSSSLASTSSAATTTISGATATAGPSSTITMKDTRFIPLKHESITDDKILPPSQPLLSTIGSESKVSTIPCDIYEFKEPEPFEYESHKKLSPDIIDKKCKKKSILATELDIKTEPKTIITTPGPASKKPKKSPIKSENSEKFRSLKTDEEMIYSPPPMTSSPSSSSSSSSSSSLFSTISCAMVTTTTTPPTTTTHITSPTSLIPPKIESIFDSLRKSPSFNLNLSAAAGQNQDEILQFGSFQRIDPEKSDSKPTFISSFIETNSDPNTIKIFELQPDMVELSPDNPNEFETAKKILSADELFTIEPPKIEKPSSIADKVLKALKQQQPPAPTPPPLPITTGHPSTVTSESDSINVPELPTKSNIEMIPETAGLTVSTIPVDIKPLQIQIDPSMVPVVEPPKIELPAIIKREIDLPAIMKPVLNSPEHKLDILESIAPKNNDLSETIQKLESVIQQSEINHISEDSSDSTDSEQRLIIEDESLSSEAQNDFGTNQIVGDKKATDAGSGSGAVDTIIKTVSTIGNVITKQEIHDSGSNENPMPHFQSNFHTGFFAGQSTPSANVIGDKIHGIHETTSIKTAVDLAAAAGASASTTSATTFYPITTMGSGSIKSIEIYEIKEPISIPPTQSLSTPNQTQPATHLLLSPPSLQQQLPQLQQSPVSQPLPLPAPPPITTTTTTSISLPVDEIQNRPDPEKHPDSVHNESLSLLLCEETIPGSPAPPNVKDTPDAKKEYDSIFASPHPSGSDTKSVPMELENVDVKQLKRGDNLSPNSSSPRDSFSHDESGEEIRKPDLNESIPRKRHRSKKPSECDGAADLLLSSSSMSSTSIAMNLPAATLSLLPSPSTSSHLLPLSAAKRRKGASRRNTATGSDSEDNNENTFRSASSSSSSGIQSRSSKPCQYNFLVDLSPALTSDQRIAILNKQIQELRKTFTMIKADLASIDRRRKKLRRREREKKNQQKLQSAP